MDPKRTQRDRLVECITAGAAVLVLGACTPPRSIDGTDNNRLVPEMGSAETPLARWMEADYGEDGWHAMQRSGPREVSNAVCAQDAPLPNPLGVSDYIWQWGQFVDHDLDLSGEAEPAEYVPIPVPLGDPWFDPFFTGVAEIPFHRSAYAPGTGVDGIDRDQMNGITAWIDASNVYGSDLARAEALRTMDGTGRLRTSEGDLLPFNVEGFPNAGGTDASLFLAGDVRANEQVGLTSLHTLFVREHNRLADIFRAVLPDAPADAIYGMARNLVGAQMQVITYKEFLPTLLGPDALAPYQGYDKTVDARVSNVFSTASYRFGHSMVSPQLLRIDANGQEIAPGHLSLASSFFAPHIITDEGGIDPILRGLAAQTAQAFDPFLVDELRNLLFGPPGAGGLDLASLNIQRGRDHGIPGYNAVREAMGLARAESFGDVSSNPEIQHRLSLVYIHPDQMDAWIGGLAEDRVPGALVGELVREVLAHQFERLRDGDRFWYQVRYGGVVRDWLEAQRLSDVIKRNTQIGDELPGDVFHVGGV